MRKLSNNLSFGIMLALGSLGASGLAMADEASVPPEADAASLSQEQPVSPQITTDPVVAEPEVVEPEICVLPPPEEKPVVDADAELETGGFDPVPPDVFTTTGIVMPEGEDGIPIAYSMGRGGDDPLPYERTMTLSSEAQESPDVAVSSLPAISAEAVSAVATLERETAVNSPADATPALEATQVVGSAGETVAAGTPAIRNGHLATP